jgi:hypothetical protein
VALSKKWMGIFVGEWPRGAPSPGRPGLSNLPSICTDFCRAEYDRERLAEGRMATIERPLLTGDRFGGAITHFHLSKGEGTSAHARRGGRANATRILELEVAGQMPMLWRSARNLRA